MSGPGSRDVIVGPLANRDERPGEKQQSYDVVLRPTARKLPGSSRKRAIRSGAAASRWNSVPTHTRYILALADDADRIRLTDGAIVIDELPGVVLAEAEVSLAKRLAREGEYVGVYASLTDAHRAFSLFEPAP
jgi:hypothetical protein